MKSAGKLEGFIQFIRTQGVVGLAVGFILGGAVSDVVSSLVQDVINPLIGAFLGQGDTLAQASISVGSARIMWGNLLNVIIDFIIIAAVVYFGVKGLGLDKLDKKKSKT